MGLGATLARCCHGLRDADAVEPRKKGKTVTRRVSGLCPVNRRSSPLPLFYRRVSLRNALGQALIHCSGNRYNFQKIVSLRPHPRRIVASFLVLAAPILRFKGHHQDANSNRAPN